MACWKEQYWTLSTQDSINSRLEFTIHKNEATSKKKKKKKKKKPSRAFTELKLPSLIVKFHFVCAFASGPVNRCTAEKKFLKLEEAQRLKISA